VAREAARDPAFADLITEWSERLEPLSALAPAVAPSDLLWSRIARDLPRQARPPRLAVWRAAAFAGFGLAACLAGVLLQSGHHLAVRIAWDLPPPAPVTAPPVPPAPPPQKLAPPAKPVLWSSRSLPLPPRCIRLQPWRRHWSMRLAASSRR